MCVSARACECTTKHTPTQIHQQVTIVDMTAAVAVAAVATNVATTAVVAVVAAAMTVAPATKCATAPSLSIVFLSVARTCSLQLCACVEC